MTRLFAEPLPARLRWDEGELRSLQVGGVRLAVVEIVQRWRVEVEWWKNGPAREYLTVRTADGLLLELYGDRAGWFLQRLMD